MRILNHWFRQFLEENNKRVENNYTNLVSQSDSISDGINHLPITRLYRSLISEAMANAQNINSYTQSAGHPMLVYGIQYYERILAGMEDNQTGFADYVKITAGATAAIQMTISYYANSESIKNVLIVGMSYYLFMSCCKQNRIETMVICSESGLCPSFLELCEKIKTNKKSLVILTQPANPSGEMYSEKELGLIVKECKHNNCVLLLDLCQYDEIFNLPNDCNITKVVRRYAAESHTVIINSFSKTRAIAGARIGYVITQDKLLAEYIDYCNEMLYFNHALGYENAIIADMFYRTVLRMPKEKQKKVIRNYRNIVLQTVGVPCYQRVFKNIFHSENLLEDAQSFKANLEENRSTILHNYQYCVDTMRMLAGVKISDLSGGYNFCIQIPIGCTEKEVVSRLTSRIGSNILSQKDFCFPAKKDAKFLWIRISGAIEKDRFAKYITKLKEEIILWN